MRNNKRRLLALLGLLVVLVFALGTTGLATPRRSRAAR